MSAGFIFFPERDIYDSQTFTGNGTFNVPEHVEFVFVEGAGGGGGGGGGQYVAAGNGIGGGGGGGSGGFRVIPVTPGGSVSVTIGAGGAGGAGGTPGTPDGVDGSDGTDSVFGSVNFPGGKGGRKGGQANGQPGAGTYFGGQGSDFPVTENHAQNSVSFEGGGLAGGGAGFFGNGAAKNASASANTGAGGGGGAGGIAGNGTAGGAGGSGQITVYWMRLKV